MALSKESRCDGECGSSRLKVLFVTSNLFTVPNVEGGSVETLLTNLIDLNEIYQDLEITVGAKYNKEAYEQSKDYKYSKFVYYDKLNQSKLIWFLRVLRYRLFGLFHIPVAKYLYSKQLLTVARNEEFDLIVVEEGDCYSFDVFAKEFGRKKMVAHTHSSWKANEKYHSIYGSVLVPSYFTKQTLIANQYEDYKSSVYVVRNCVDDQILGTPVSNEECKELKESLGIPKNHIVLFFAGRIDANKGIEELIYAMDEVENCTLVIAGDVLLGVKKETSFSKRIASLVNERTNVICTGYVPFTSMYRYYHMCDLAIMPSYANESCCLSNLEAMYVGKPILSTKNGGIVEYIQDGRNGILVDVQDLKNNLVQEIHHFQHHPELLEMFALNNLEDRKAYTRKSYYDSMRDTLLEIYRLNQEENDRGNGCTKE